MPYIEIRVGTTLDEQQRQKIYAHTTSLMNSVMGKRRDVTVVHIEESQPGSWATNATALNAEAPVGAYVDIKVTQGTNSAEEKAQMLHDTVAMLKEVVGTVQEACYVVIDEIPGDSWGYNGKSQAARAANRL